MNEGIGRYTSKFFPKSPGKHKQVVGKQDYRAKLWNTPVGETDTDVEDVQSCRYADQIRDVIGGLENGVAFQSVAVGSLQTLRLVLSCEKEAAEAAISLAQGEKLQAMISSCEITADAIADALDAQGSRMLNLASDDAVGEDGDNSWWFALTETIQSIEDGTKRILSLASGQPKGGSARQLSSIVIRLLRAHHRQLLSEADAWIS